MLISRNYRRKLHSVAGKISSPEMLFPFVRNLIFFKNGEVTDALAWPPDDFHVMRNVRQNNLPLYKNYISTKLNQQSVRFCIQFYYEYSLPYVYCKLHTSIQLLWRLNCLHCFSFSIRDAGFLLLVETRFFLVITRNRFK